MTLKACDLFCGAGGTTAGAEATGECRVDFAVNHWDIAVQTHSANFPHTKHVNSRLDMVNPGECSRIDLLFASPECTHHSRARGGKPTSDQQRSGAWDLMRWIEHHRPTWIVVENVREFREWGPVHNGRPMKSKRGAFFDSWIAAIKSAGYAVEYRLLNAADFGAATSRERLFVIARKGRRNPVWPEPTHCETSGNQIPGMALPKWRAAAEIIDWSIPCPSIFCRQRPLADKTLARIEAGLRRFVGPHIVPFFGERSGQPPRSHAVDGALPCVTSHGAGGLAVPFQYQLIGLGAGRSRNVAEPMPTIVATRENHGVAVPFVLPRQGFYDSHVLKRCRGVDEPIPTITASHIPGAVVVPFTLSQASGGAPRDVGSPVPTIVTGGAVSLIAPYLLDVNHGESGHSGSRTNSVDDPLGAITSTRGKGLAVPFLSSYYGNGGCSGVDTPAATITTKDRLSLSVAYAGSCTLWEHALAHCFDRDLRNEFATSAMGSLLRTMHELGVADIGFRMLTNPELALAQGFAPSYIFCGNKSDVTRQIGNSVSPDQARALTEAILAA